MSSIIHQSTKEIVLRDSALAENEIRIPTGQFRRQRSMPSLMPDGLADQLKDRQEFLDLANFLSQLGRPGPFETNERPFTRKWRVLSGEPDTMPTEDGAWLPAYSLVNGELPTAALGEGGVTYVQGYVNILVAGLMRLNLNPGGGFRLWVDGNEVNDLTASIPVSRGRKTLTFAIDKARRGSAGLRVLLVPGDDNVKFQPEGGI